MIIKNIYSREFSKIDNIQKRKTVNYNICEVNNGVSKIYGINISEIKMSKIKEKTVENISSNYYKVSNILQFLYENSIGIVSFKDIIEDLLNE